MECNEGNMQKVNLLHTILEHFADHENLERKKLEEMIETLNEVNKEVNLVVEEINPVFLFDKTQ